MANISMCSREGNFETLKTRVLNTIFLLSQLYILQGCADSPKPGSGAPKQDSQHQTVLVKDPNEFYVQLRKAFEHKDPDLLYSLMASKVQCNLETINGPCEWKAGCPKAEVIAKHFKDKSSVHWAKFDLMQRFPGLSARYFEGAEIYVSPNFPDTSSATEAEFAYVFASNVHLRSAPAKTATSLGKIGQRFIEVDREEVCYGNHDEDWLPVFLPSGKEAYVYTELTNWSKVLGIIEIVPDENGYLQIVAIKYSTNYPGTWNSTGCC